jgi:hypothetical protein
MASNPQAPAEEPGRPEGAGDGKKRTRKARGTFAPPRSPAPTAEPVLSGRLVLVVALFVAMVFIPLSPLSTWISKKAPAPTQMQEWKVGSEGTVHVTVVTADYNKLACAHPEAVNGFHCAYSDERKAWAPEPGAPLDDNKARIIQPYRTTDGTLLLLAGLWAQPEVATRLHNEPPNAVAENKLARFVLECRVRFLADWQEVPVRWGPGQPFARQGNGEEGKTKTAPVAEPLECHILERKRTS